MRRTFIYHLVNKCGYCVSERTQLAEMLVLIT